jgi:DNA-binding CsgD family transcriptional regulator
LRGVRKFAGKTFCDMPSDHLRAIMRAVHVGRDAELVRLAALLADDVPVVVLGEAGVGKTTLLRAAAAASERATLEGGALSTLDWLDYLALERALERPMLAGDPTAVADDVEAATGDAILLLDDLHWAGVATLEVISHLAGRVGMLAGVRSGEAGTGRAVEQLRAAGFEVVELAGLDAAASAELVDHLRPDLSAAGRTRLVARTGGNPLLLRELAMTGEPSASLRLALAARLRGLDAVGREAFGVLALAGRPVNPDSLGEAGVKSLLAADLAMQAPAGIEVRHALLAELAIEQMSPDEQRARHAHIARNVEDDGEAARHFALAGEPADAFVAAMRAAQATTRPAERASHLAVAASCAAGPEADDLRLLAARALEEAHDHDGVLRTLALISADNREAQAEAQLLRARTAWTGGDADGLIAALDAGLELVAGSGSPTEVRLRIEHSRIPIFVQSDVELGVAESRSALDTAKRTGVDVPRAEYLFGTALACADLPGAEDELRRAIADARAAGDTSTEFLAANNLISFNESSGDPAVARELCAEFIDRAHDLGLGEWERSFRIAGAGLDFHAGLYEAVLGCEDVLTQTLEPRGRDYLMEAFCLALVDVGRIDEAVRRIDAAEPSFAKDSRGRIQAAWVRTEAALWGGQPLRAIEFAERILEETSGDPNTIFGWVSRAWACFDLGRDPGGSAPEHPRPMLSAIPPEVDGVRALHANDPSGAVPLFTEAAGLWAPYHYRGQVRCVWASGEALRRTGDLPAAVATLERAERLALDRGMLPMLGRVHRALRAAGQRRSAPRTRHAGSTLTGRQRQVLALVADGLTNAEIAHRLGISRHTVVTQLASASAKLGAASRAQAASLAATAPADDS